MVILLICPELNIILNKIFIFNFWLIIYIFIFVCLWFFFLSIFVIIIIWQTICETEVHTNESLVRLKTVQLLKLCERQIPEGNYLRITFLLILSYSIQCCIYQQHIICNKYLAKQHILSIGIHGYKMEQRDSYNQIIIFCMFHNWIKEYVLRISASRHEYCIVSFICES